MRKHFLFIALLGLLLASCSEDNSSVQPQKSSFWKNTGIQYWWTPRDAANQYGPLVRIAVLPYNSFFTVSGYTYHLGGMDYAVSCMDSSHIGGTVRNHTFAWDIMPSRMVADSLYPIGAEVKGPWSGMTLITNPGDYTLNHPSYSNDWVVSANRNEGRKTAEVKIPKPVDVDHPRQMAIMVQVNCAYAVISHIYLYDWVTE
jgi:hypothetical protein